MREISVETIASALSDGIRTSACNLGARELEALTHASEVEESDTGRAILNQILENAAIAACENRPLCQDTGVAVVFLAIGQEVILTGGDLNTAINSTIAATYQGSYLRKSMVKHPLARVNTGDNTPGIVHIRLVPGDQVRLTFAAKGGGCENMSRTAMLSPSSGREGVLDFIVNTVVKAGGNPCPPVIVGVGLGGNFEKAGILAKEALLRPLGTGATHPIDAELENEALELINSSGSGPMGLGGTTTALAVHLNSHPCHIASLPVAVNLDCHSHRHAEVVI